MIVHRLSDSAFSPPLRSGENSLTAALGYVLTPGFQPRSTPLRCAIAYDLQPCADGFAPVPFPAAEIPETGWPHGRKTDFIQFPLKDDALKPASLAPAPSWPETVENAPSREEDRGASVIIFRRLRFDLTALPGAQGWVVCRRFFLPAKPTKTEIHSVTLGFGSKLQLRLQILNIKLTGVRKSTTPANSHLSKFTWFRL